MLCCDLIVYKLVFRYTSTAVLLFVFHLPGTAVWFLVVKGEVSILYPGGRILGFSQLCKWGTLFLEHLFKCDLNF